MLLNYYTTILINLLVERYFQDRRCLLIFTDDDNNNSDFNINYNGRIPTVQIVDDSQNYNLIFHHYGCQGIIINTEDPSDTIQRFENEIYHHLERFNRRRYLILSNFSGNYKKIYKLPQLRFIADLLIIVPQISSIISEESQLNNNNNNNNDSDSEIIFQFETHKYIGIDNHNQSIILDKWFANNQSFQFNLNLYPDKLTNQYGRNLYLGTFTYEPYSIVGNTTKESYGSEYSVGYYYCKTLNMTPVIIANDVGYWGDIYPNGTGYGLLGNLIDDKADIGFSALYTWEFCYNYLDLTKPLVRTGITCLVPAPKLAAGWLTPLHPYTTQIWTGIILSFCSSVLILTLGLRFYNNNNEKHLLAIFNKSILIIFKQFLLQSLTNDQIPKGVVNRLIIYLVLIYGLFITAIYNSGFASIMTIPRYENPIDTVDQLIGSDLSWGATSEAWIMSIRTSNNSRDIKLVDKFIKSTEEELYGRAKRFQFGFSIERLPYENFAIGDYLTEDVIANYHLMQEDFYWENSVIMTRKNSILLPSLDDFVLRVFEAGLISKWQNVAVMLFMNFKVQNIIKYYNHHHHNQQDNKNFIKLKWVHVEGAFAILIIGHSISLIIFMMEIFLKMKKRK